MKIHDSSASRLPGLDLMRAIAILWVMLFHFRFICVPAPLTEMARRGWMGVDLFFVLSGYLIGSQLLRPYISGERPSLADFYLRRVFPCAARIPGRSGSLSGLVPSFREAPGLSPTWQFLTFTENFRIDYFHDQAFSHVWSLCVEEHFYLVLPILVLVMMRKPSFGKTLTIDYWDSASRHDFRGYVFNHQLAQGLASDDRERFHHAVHRKDLLPHILPARWASHGRGSGRDQNVSSQLVAKVDGPRLCGTCLRNRLLCAGDMAFP